MAESTVKKVTKKENFATVRSIIEAADVENKAEILAFIDHEVELLNKKTSSGKATKAQEQNIELMEIVINALANGGKMSVAEVMAMVDDEFTAKGVIASNQKVTALLTKLLNDGKVIHTVDKKKAFFELA
jgi:hypothetical protein